MPGGVCMTMPLLTVGLDMCAEGLVACCGNRGVPGGVGETKLLLLTLTLWPPMGEGKL